MGPIAVMVTSTHHDNQLFAGLGGTTIQVTVTAEVTLPKPAPRTCSSYKATPGGSSKPLFASTSDLGDYFGVAVALQPGRAVVGAHLADAIGAVDSGKAYVFDK